jgi:hypothetical protein
MRNALKENTLFIFSSKFRSVCALLGLLFDCTYFIINNETEYFFLTVYFQMGLQCTHCDKLSWELTKLTTGFYTAI